VIKPTAASPHLLHHRGKAYVFENHQQLEEQMNLDYLPVDANSILVMKNGGPKGAPGFPEWGWLPMPKMLLKQGITDVVRVSDSRMSGTSFGTVVLHVAPESAIGGPLAIVQTGDEITLDVPNRRIDLNIPVDEIERRLMKFTPPPPHYERGYGKLFLDHVTQAHEGCDFDFLQALPAKK
jgi:L-arabonate dehydrase